VSGRKDIPTLEALLARVQLRAQMPRRPAVHAPAPLEAAAAPERQLEAEFEAPQMPTVPPTPDARAAIETEVSVHRTPPPAPPAPIAPIEVVSATRIVAEPPAVPMESRARLVGEANAELIELDEGELISAESGPAQEILIDEEVEMRPPPSSKRPIPMEAIAEAQQHEPPPPPPPESGKLVAAVPAFDDDFTGVREASHQLPPLEANEPSIEIQHIEPPKPAVRHEMEADLAGAHAEHGEQRISDVAPVAATPAAHAPPKPIRPEITPARLPSGETVVVMAGAVEPFAPQTFGELLDASLAL
jgi:hypothetical protein